MNQEYKDLRSTIKSGDIVAWSHNGIVRLFTGSEYSHVGTAWVVGERVFVIEAVQPMVRIYPLSKLLPFYHISSLGDWTQEAEEFALSQVGTNYSVMDAIRSYFGKISPDGNWQCAELAAAIAKLNGVDLGENYRPSAIVKKALTMGGSLTLLT
jgi:hypothetical protein